MIPDDHLIPGSQLINKILLYFSGFNHSLFIKAMSRTENDAFEVWKKKT